MDSFCTLKVPETQAKNVRPFLLCTYTTSQAFILSELKQTTAPSLKQILQYQHFLHRPFAPKIGLGVYDAMVFLLFLDHTF